MKGNVEISSVERKNDREREKNRKSGKETNKRYFGNEGKQEIISSLNQMYDVIFW